MTYPSVGTLLDRLEGVKEIPSGWLAFCPAHPDGTTRGRQSLKVTRGERAMLLQCFAGCTLAAILEALEMRPQELFFDYEPKEPKEPRGGDAPRKTPTSSLCNTGPAPVQATRPAPAPTPSGDRKLVAEYVYTDETGAPLMRVCRYEPKSFTQHAWNGSGWDSKLGETRRVLYRLPAVIEAVAAAQTVYVVEGEKDVEALEGCGLVATTVAGGAGALKPEVLQPLTLATEVVVIPDNDEPGRKFADKVVDTLRRANPSIAIRVIDLSAEVPQKGDVSDYLAARSPQALMSLISRTREEEEEVRRHADPSGYFEEKTFVPSRLASELWNLYDLAVGHEGILYRFNKGVYVPDGERFIRSRCVETLGEHYRTGRVQEVVSWCLMQEPVVFQDDRNPNFLDVVNVRNGLLRWRDLDLSPHTPQHYSTIQIPVTYDPAARCPEIHRFFTAYSPSAEFMYELLGLLLIPYVGFRRAFLFTGPSGTGKSTALNLISALLGSDNISSRSLHLLSEDKFASADLQGKLANVYPDLDARGVDRSDAFKVLVGAESWVPAERKFGPAYKFPPTARLIFSANETPGSRDQTDAWYERWVVVPFERKAPRPGEAGYDPDITRKLTAPQELSGLLNESLRGLKRLMDRRGFEPPASVVQAGEEYRVSHDTVKAFAQPGEGVTYLPHARVGRTELYEGYTLFCQRQGQRPVSQAKFTRRFRAEVGDSVDEVSVQGKRFFKGVGLAA